MKSAAHCLWGSPDILELPPPLPFQCHFHAKHKKQDERVLRQPASGHRLQRRSAAATPRPGPSRRHLPGVPDRLHGGRQREAHLQHEAEGPMVSKKGQMRLNSSHAAADQRRRYRGGEKEGVRHREGLLFHLPKICLCVLEGVWSCRFSALDGIGDLWLFDG